MAEAVLTALIVDDEPPARALLRLMCEEAGLTVVGEAADGIDALARAADTTPMLVLLDIAMPGMDGMAVARALADTEWPPAIVFTTAYAEHAVTAFDVGAVDYLLKPIDPDRLALAIERVRAEARPKTDHLWLPAGAGLVRVPLDSVTRVEAERDYVRVHAGGRSYLLRETMNAIQERLPAKTFLRLHRSAIVRRDVITGLRHDGAGSWSALLSEGEPARIGRSHLAALRGALNLD